MFAWRSQQRGRSRRPDRARQGRRSQRRRRPACLPVKDLTWSWTPYPRGPQCSRTPRDAAGRRASAACLWQPAHTHSSLEQGRHPQTGQASFSVFDTQQGFSIGLHQGMWGAASRQCRACMSDTHAIRHLRHARRRWRCGARWPAAWQRPGAPCHPPCCRCRRWRRARPRPPCAMP